jgi:hypothetical protein
VQRRQGHSARTLLKRAGDRKLFREIGSLENLLPSPKAHTDFNGNRQHAVHQPNTLRPPGGGNTCHEGIRRVDRQCALTTHQCSVCEHVAVVAHVDAIETRWTYRRHARVIRGDGTCIRLNGFTPPAQTNIDVRRHMHKV